MSLGAYLIPGRDFGAAVDLARRAEALGYDRVWVTHGVGRDSFLVLQAYGAATTRLTVGNGVVPIFPRHPTAMAQSALTLSETTRGRFVLGIGVSHRPMMEAMLGVTFPDPLEAMREYVAVLRGALGAGADVQGRYYHVRWSIGLPERPPAPPIYLAALAPKMCELAGEIADGAILWLCPPDYVRDVAVPALERGRRRAGKTLAGFAVVSAVPVAVTDDRAAALTAFRAELTRYLALPYYRAMLQGAGFGKALKEFDTTGETPVALADALGAIGDAASVRAYVAAYRAAGVTVPAIRPITFPDAPWYRRSLEDAAGS